MSTTEQLTKTLTDPRFERGLTLLKEKRLEEAVVAFEDLLRTMCETEQLGNSLSVAPVYYQYGHALLSLAEATASLFGGAVGGSGSGEDAEQDARDAVEDLEAAWEMLELARVIYARHPGDLAVEAQLVKVYTRLGDLGLESDQFEQARTDFEKALMLRRKLLKEEKAEDTTQLADLYCSLAIASIYRDSTAADAEKSEQEKKQDQDEASAKRDEEGLKYYVLAGRVMAENIHRVAPKCEKPLQEFVDKRVPKYSEEDVATVSKGKGKRKAGADDSKRSLLFTSGKPEDMKQEFTVCAKGDKKQEKLSKDEEQLLEYLEIYLELKEKVDGIKETAAGAVPQENKAEPATTIGFGQTDAKTAEATTVNVIPVVKKRKTEASTEAK